jgi:16S rRNA C967 or C1407 C5-methylase (RsmB/RsmF family)
LQLKILLRALELIKVGGTVCYSTCSLNPIEDEAVVSAALREMNKDRKSYELLEWPRDLLPGFKRRPGVDNWKVAFYDENRLENEYDDFGSLKFYSTYDDAVVAGVGEEASKSFWPHSTNHDQSLHRCTRLLPDDHDTGGFFLVLIKRI